MSTTMIQIRNVPDDVHRRAKALAALEGMTLSDFCLQALERALAHPRPAEIMARIRQLEPVEAGPTSEELIRELREGGLRGEAASG